MLLLSGRSRLLSSPQCLSIIRHPTSVSTAHTSITLQKTYTSQSPRHNSRINLLHKTCLSVPATWLLPHTGPELSSTALPSPSTWTPSYYASLHIIPPPTPSTANAPAPSRHLTAIFRPDDQGKWREKLRSSYEQHMKMQRWRDDEEGEGEAEEVGEDEDEVESVGVGVEEDDGDGAKIWKAKRTLRNARPMTDFEPQLTLRGQLCRNNMSRAFPY
ncbi:hypothetical protein CY34DRAFT_19978 [Suillus luteus UH-Slu-Lm8-n1]|uniref:Uncharacterized protein n=1 Tax=Suillus luteus UH-Slu-Lm8-n1 TaxID=930992 RepID=A0A0C9ZZN2_9AGAM|nr:hypothetical protein CY34DRAFT_19978 [Suillus luteus UH-Slu-Lm8-n1]